MKIVKSPPVEASYDLLGLSKNDLLTIRGALRCSDNVTIAVDCHSVQPAMTAVHVGNSVVKILGAMNEIEVQGALK